MQRIKNRINKLEKLLAKHPLEIREKEILICVKQKDLTKRFNNKIDYLAKDHRTNREKTPCRIKIIDSTSLQTVRELHNLSLCLKKNRNQVVFINHNKQDLLKLASLN